MEAWESSFIQVVCTNCGNPFPKRKAEYTRSEKLGRPHYCNRTCSSKANYQKSPPPKVTDHLPKGRELDELSPFRWFALRCTGRTKKGPTDISPEYLKELWDSQKGICPFTGWELKLPRGTAGFKGQSPRNASLDRIDSAKGYLKGNVQFICVMANYAKNVFCEDSLIEFCQAVAKKNV